MLLPQAGYMDIGRYQINCNQLRRKRKFTLGDKMFDLINNYSTVDTSYDLSDRDVGIVVPGALLLRLV